MNKPVDNIGALTQQLQALQAKSEELAKLNTSPEVAPSSAPATTYPRIQKAPECVEDILANPVWKAELQNQFANSDMYARAKNYMDVAFSEFCEKETGFPSTLLNSLRQQNPIPKVPKKGGKPNGQAGDKTPTGTGSTEDGETA